MPIGDNILRAALRFFQSVQELFDRALSDPDLPHLDVLRKANIVCVPFSTHMDALSVARAHTEEPMYGGRCVHTARFA
jgi:hypothetical protein